MDIGLFYSFGHGKHGQLANGQRCNENAPKLSAVLAGHAVEEVVSGFRHTLFRTAEGLVLASGSNAFGQLGQGTKSDSSYQATPVLVPLPTGSSSAEHNVVRCAAGANHSVLLTQKGELWSFGHDGHNQLGRDGSTLRPRRIIEGLNDARVIDVAAGNDHTVAVTEEGLVYSWGRGAENQLGYGDGFDHASPRLIECLRPIHVVKICCGQLFCVAEDDSGGLWSWGANSEGQLGRGQRHGSSEPRQIRALRDKNIVDFFCGWKHAGAINVEGDLWVWGQNKFGQLGLLPFPGDEAAPSTETIQPGVDPASDSLASSSVDVGGGDGSTALSSSNLLEVPSSRSVSRRSSEPGLSVRGGGDQQTSADSGSETGRSSRRNSTGNSPSVRQQQQQQQQYYPRLVRGLLAGQHVAAACGGWKHTVVRTATGDVFVTGTDSYGSLGLGDAGGVRARRARAGCFQLVMQGCNAGPMAAGGEHTVIVAESIRTLPLACHLRQLQASGVAADCQFTLAQGHGTRFAAHQCVLSVRAPRLLRLVHRAARRQAAAAAGGGGSDGDMEKPVVRLRNGSPAAFELLLMFVYGDDCGLTRLTGAADDQAKRQLILELQALASRYKLNRLHALCDRLMNINDSISNNHEHDGGDDDDDDDNDDDDIVDRSIQPTLCRDIGSLLGSQKFADVLLQVEQKDFGDTREGNLIYAHQALLHCRAPVAAGSNFGLHLADDDNDDDYDDGDDNGIDKNVYDDDDGDDGSDDDDDDVGSGGERFDSVRGDGNSVEARKKDLSKNSEGAGAMAMEAVFVEDVQFADFYRLLRWIYENDRTPVARADALTLLAASDKYGIDSVKTLCLNTIMVDDGRTEDGDGLGPMITSENVPAFLQLGKTCHAPRLVTFCLDLMIWSRSFHSETKFTVTAGDESEQITVNLDGLEADEDLQLLRERLAQEIVPQEDDDDVDAADAAGLFSRAADVADTITGVIGNVGGALASRFLKRRSKSPTTTKN